MSDSSVYRTTNYQPNFKPVQNLFEDRLRQFVDRGGPYVSLNLPKFYDYKRTDSPSNISLTVYEVPDLDRPLFKDIKDISDEKYRGAHKGDVFGPSWKSFWFKLNITIPTEWTDKFSEEDVIELDWDCNNEGLIYDSEGKPLQAFTGGGERTLYVIPSQYYDGKTHLFYLEIACNGMFGNGNGMGPPDPNRYFRLDRADLVWPNLEARKLYWDFWILGDAAREFPNDSYQKHSARQVCNQIMDAFNSEDASSISKCREIAKSFLSDEIDSDDVFYVGNKKNDENIDVYGIGNCHIDTAWLWPFDETKRKVVRSWTTQLRLMEKYPEYQFVASQAQQFKWLLKYHPDIFADLKKKYRTNQFIPIGGTWVENDTNMPNGESLIRQFLLGQRFFLQHFGKQSDVFWLPDTFGYSSQIPQLCRLAGIDKFLTQKLSWNNINTFPLTNFNWVALDGTQVLVHMPPANTYTAAAHFGDVVRSQSQNKNLENSRSSLLLYGHGDGGGGPSEEMIEKLRRCRGISNKHGRLPTVQLGKTVNEFYKKLLHDTNQGEDLPSWNGEIYLEFHRGTYTTQADVKKGIRLGEAKLHDLEYVATLISLFYPGKYSYPKLELQQLWETICLCQFHDVLPGSCIELVYKDVKPMLNELISKANKLIRKALDVLKQEDKKWKISSINSSPTTSLDDLTFINTLPWYREEIVEIPRSKLDLSGLSKINKKSIQISSSKESYLVSLSSNAGSNTMAPCNLNCGASVEEIHQNVFVLSNGALRAVISSGIVVSLKDTINEREYIDITKTKETGNGKFIGANQFLLFDDEPLSFEAWDTELYSLKKFQFLDEPDKISIHENGPLRASIKVEHTISPNSSIETIISLDGLSSKEQASSTFLRFKCKVNWHESHKFLKVQFPTFIRTAQQANYETQFGITQRPTHYNTSWDVARFETCHQKFMDLSSHSCGVTVLNNCKYGGSIHGNLIRLSLLRSPKNPDANADMGEHEFEYALYPHNGYLSADSVKLGWNFNYRIDENLLIPKSLDTGLLEKWITLKSSSSSSIILSHIKRSEDDEDVSTHPGLKTHTKGVKSFIVRLYESLGGASTARLIISPELAVQYVHKVNILEDKIEIVKSEESSDGFEYAISLRGFEVASYKVSLLPV